MNDEHDEVRATATIRNLPPRVVLTWVEEFGYKSYTAGLIAAERGVCRWARELANHAKRLAERSQMDGRRQVSAVSSVIR